jgi:hypothetical protein
LTGTEPNTGLIGRTLAWWVDVVRHAALWVVLLSALTTGLLFLYTVKNLGINTDTTGMISERLKWRQTYLAYKEAFPQYFGDIVVVIDGATPDLADQARDRLAESLERETGLFESVYLPGGGSFFKRHGLLYLDIEELEDLADNLAQVQPFLGKVVQDQSLIGLFSMLDSAMEAVLDGEEVDLVPVFDRLSDAFAARINNRFHRVSWQELMLGRTSTPDEQRRFIMLQSRLDFTELLQREAAIAKIRNWNSTRPMV